MLTKFAPRLLGEGSIIVTSQTAEETAAQLAETNRDIDNITTIIRDTSFATGDIFLDVGAALEFGENYTQLQVAIETLDIPAVINDFLTPRDDERPWLITDVTNDLGEVSITTAPAPDDLTNEQIEARNAEFLAQRGFTEANAPLSDSNLIAAYANASLLLDLEFSLAELNASIARLEANDGALSAEDQLALDSLNIAAARLAEIEAEQAQDRIDEEN